MTSDPYSVLGIPRGASETEARDAYRRLAKQYHPDLHPGDAYAAQKMNEINEAYDAIRNPARHLPHQNPQQTPRRQRYEEDPYARGYGETRRQDYKTAGSEAWEEAFRQAEQQQKHAAPRAGVRFGRLFLTLLLGYLMVRFLTGGCARLLGGGYAGSSGGQRDYSFAFPYEKYHTAPSFDGAAKE